MSRNAANRNRRGQVNLDTGPVVHNLYVRVLSPGERPSVADQRSRQLTLAILKYIHARIPLFKKMGVQVKIHKVTGVSLANARLRQAMKQRGITSLPSLVATNTYVGNRSIVQVYETNIAEYQAFLRRGREEIKELVSEEDELSAFYGAEMTFEKAEDDTGFGEGGLGEDSTDMMDSYRRMLDRRAQNDKNRKPNIRPKPSKKSGKRSPRAGNVRAPASTANIDDLIESMAGDIDPQTFSEAFSQGGGDSYDPEDGGRNAQDDLMERSFWANQEMSM